MRYTRSILFGLSIAAVAVGASAAPSAGETYFKRSCAMCHSVEAGAANGAGPGLAGVLGRKVGAWPDYPYSDVLTQAGAKGKLWSSADLDAFLANPNKMYPGTKMPINVADKADREAVVAYLATLKVAAPTATKAGAPAAASAAASASKAGTQAAAGVAGAPAVPAEQWRNDIPGTVHRFSADQLIKPFATSSAGNGPKMVPRPAGALPKVPAGFKVNLFATDPDKGRLMLRAPNGDIFVSSPNNGEIKVMRSSTGEVADTTSVFAAGLDKPYGIAFYPSGPNPKYLYVANINSIVRIPYKNGELKAGGAPEVVVPRLTAAPGGHVTRSIAFSGDDKQLFVSIGSATNIAETMTATAPMPLPQWEAKTSLGAAWGDELDRALVLAFEPNGGNRHVYATGLRNCVGLVLYPPTGELLCSVNERDLLGDNLPPDYVTRVKQGGFYGWPWYYIGNNEDPRLAGARPDLKGKAIVPDTLLQAHSAPLGLTPYLTPKGAKSAFPKAYEGDVFLALHGSWNRATRAGSKVVRVRMKNGVPTGDYEDFLSGMIVSDHEVWGRPSSVVVAADGALLVDDDANGLIWRVVPN
jgi:glucose/arabinose dehydrogenase